MENFKLNDSELDTIVGGTVAETNRLDKLIKIYTNKKEKITIDNDKEYIAYVFDVDVSKVTVKFSVNENIANVFNVDGKNYNTDEMCKKIDEAQKYYTFADQTK